MANQLCIVLDFGGQYNQLIARRVRDCNVYAEIMPYTASLEEIKESIRKRDEMDKNKNRKSSRFILMFQLF